MVLTPNDTTRIAGHGTVTVLARMVSQTNFVGNWRSSIGTAGTLDVRRDAEPTVQKRTKVFISYSHHDADWLERVRVHLKPLERDYKIDIWDDSKIQAGSKWREEIQRAIRSAKVALLIVSADFLASDFVANNELPPLLDAAEKEGSVILPLIVSPCRFKSTKNLSQFQAVNDPSRALINMTKGEQEEVLVELSEAIEIALNSTRSQ